LKIIFKIKIKKAKYKKTHSRAQSVMSSNLFEIKHFKPKTYTSFSHRTKPFKEGVNKNVASFLSKKTTNMSLMSNNSINLNQINSISQSVLFVNVKELNLKIYNEIVVSWNILEETSTSDWIGIYKTCK
jgi:hypothetical protein